MHIAKELLCPICDGGSSEAFVKDGYDIRGCAECGHRFTQPSVDPQQHVNAAYSDDYFFSGGAGYSDYLADEKLLHNRGQWYAKILNQQGPPGRILDVGAAAGFILKGFVDSGWTGRGIEPNDRMASVARGRLGLEVLTGMLENLPVDDQYDAVSMIQVLPHFIDPKRAMSVVANVLKPGGLLLIETWNRSSWTAKFFGKNWHEYSPPSVLHWFDPAGVARLGGQFGLTQIARGRPSKKISAAHAKSLLRHKFGPSWIGRMMSGAMNICPDRVNFPYPAEDLFWIMLRKESSPKSAPKSSP
jgi:SAM-dependent methyltransferase